MADDSKYGYGMKIYSEDRKFEKVFTDKEFLEKINQCHHITSLDHETKDTIRIIEKTLSPLKPKASSLLIETRGGIVISTMSLEDFFLLLDLGKRVKITNRYPEEYSQGEDTIESVDEEIRDLLE